MNVPSLIERKRDGQELDPAEIQELVSAFTAGEIPDYQMSAWAMAVYFQGLSDAETATLTAAMRDSGRVWKWPGDTPPKVDKHSTGGIGDKVSLVLAPLLAADGLWVPMVSGRGLGITGGTLDKLESIPGFNVQIDEASARRQLERIGVFMAGQTADICPADKKLYALRDVTGTVPSRPLIIASIMSKKLAESLDRLVLDVKFGSGAFMKSRDEAILLAAGLEATGRANGVATSHLLSPMDEPLGRTVGNALEVVEAIETLQGRGPEDLVDLTLDLAERVATTSRESLARRLLDGSAYEKFVAMVESQGGDPMALQSPLCPAPVIRPLPAPASGVIRRIDAGIIGRVVVDLGGGRRRTTDSVDFSVGLSEIQKTGTLIGAGEPVLFIHAASDAAADEAAHALVAAMEIE